jgi:hypothetical protein
MTNCKPTVVSSVALIACIETDHVWSPTLPHPMKLELTARPI